MEILFQKEMAILACGGGNFPKKEKNGFKKERKGEEEHGTCLLTGNSLKSLRDIWSFLFH